MDKEIMNHFRRRLISEKMKVLKNLNNMENMEEYASMENYDSELSYFDNHPADSGTEVFIREQDEGFKNQLKETLFEIEESFEDMRNGLYGICKICNKEIDRKRLEVRPFSKTCIECSEDIQPKEKMYESLDDKYMTTTSNNPEEIGYDREDAYLDLVELDIVEGDPSFSTGDFLGLVEEEDSIDDLENISQEYYDETLK